ESGLTGRVLLMGQVADVGGLLKQADAYVLSSSYEGFPNSLCEAMAAGLACVSTNCPSGPGEVVDNGENGLLVTVDDAEALAAALSSIMRDAALRERLGTRAKNICQRFSLSQVMAQWQGVVTQCTEIRTGGGR
ncbi:MAG: glycosyltransferase, partial [Humidesulfovibrio sp.]|nr:glycosyltransferase [Humidesulfovibrio sp.]